MASDSIPEEARAMERLVVRIRALTTQMISLDGYQRWGGGGPAEMNAAMEDYSRLLSDQLEAKRSLEKLVAETRSTNPSAVASWAEAHVRLLERFLETSDDKTGTFVAKGELSAWRALRDGGSALVDENTVYVVPDRVLHRELFGDLDG